MSDRQSSDRLAPTTLARLNEAQDRAHVDPGARARIRAANSVAARPLVVLDDDPTGSQVVHDLPVLTSWDDDDLRWAFGQPSGTFFILTNTRSMDSEATRVLLTDLAGRIARIAEEFGTRPILLSRSDSTLRGHFPLETDVLAEVAREQGRSYDAVLLVPAYLDAGRVTVDDVHYVRTGDDYLPAGQTQYATDDAFGYRESDLRAWVREKTGDSRLPVVSLSLTDIRKGGVEEVAGKLLEARNGTVVVVNALEESDLEIVALALVSAEATGWRAICRVGPSFVPVRAGLERRSPLRSTDIFSDIGSDASGLVVVGSHMDLTTRQVGRLLELQGIDAVELDVSRLLVDEEARRELDRCTDEIVLASGRGDVLLMTSRTRVVLETGEASLEFARRVSAALVELTRRTMELVDVSWVIAKGGITSHDVATDGLHIRRATVLGQLFDGIVSVWRNETDDDGGRLTGLPYVVFAGNVGDETTLRDAATILRGGRRE